MSRKRFKNRPPDSPSSAVIPWPEWSSVLKALIILLAGTWVLFPSLRGTWYGDDDLYLASNPLIYDPDRLWKAWFAPGSFIEYYPIEQTVQWYQFQLWGIESAFPYHVTNLVLHLASALLIWHLFSKLGLKLAWLGGLIFAIHPLMVDTVGVACELKSTLSLPPFLLALCAWLDFEQTRKMRPYLMALLLFLAAMLCKITMDFFPVLILLYAWWKRGRIAWVDVKASLPFFAISLVLGWLLLHCGNVYAQSTHYVSPAPIHLGGPITRLALAGLCLGFYFGHSFLPLHPVPFYPLWPMEPLTPWLFVPWLGIALVAVTCWIKRNTWGRPTLFALGFFVMGLAPFLGFNEVSYMCLAWVHDHFLYIPIIALIALVVAGLEGIGQQLPKNLRLPGMAIVALALALLGGQTYAYADLFGDHVELWHYNVRYNPGAFCVHSFYATELDHKGDTAGALREIHETLRLDPLFDNGLMTLGLLSCKTGDFVGAVDAFQKCLQVNPHYDGARLFLGVSLLASGHPEDAEKALRTYLQAHPESPEGHRALGQALSKMNRAPEAQAEAETAAKLNAEKLEIEKQWQAMHGAAQ